MILQNSSARFLQWFAVAVTGIASSVFAQTPTAAEASARVADTFHGALLAAGEVTSERLRELKIAGVNAVVIPIHNDSSARVSERNACGRVRDAGLALGFWVEVARCPELADAHPNWMASLQGHPEWRRFFKETPQPSETEVVKTYPWVSILNKEPFDGQLSRVTALLKDRPASDHVFLNDLQGAPSACGCGHHLCRWTSDYGKRRTTTPLTNTAPAEFAAAVKKLTPLSEVIPVWATECEEHGGSKDGLCAGVRCFRGKCWKAWTEQLMAAADECRTIGALLPYKEFERDLPVYGPEAGWITHAVESFQSMPARYKARPVSASRLLAVLQGWEVTDREITVQISTARAAGVQRVLIAYDRIEQGWQPRITRFR